MTLTSISPSARNEAHSRFDSATHDEASQFRLVDAIS